MTDPAQPRRRRFTPESPLPEDPRERLQEAFGAELADRLDPEAHYAIARVGSAEFAFSDYDAFAAALQAAWEAGRVPAHGPSLVLGADLPEVAPSLQGVDVDLPVLVSSWSAPEEEGGE
jgi:hypothetical protein